MSIWFDHVASAVKVITQASSTEFPSASCVTAVVSDRAGAEALASTCHVSTRLQACGIAFFQTLSSDELPASGAPYAVRFKVRQADGEVVYVPNDEPIFVKLWAH